MVPCLRRRSSSSENSRFTMSSMTSRGVKCSPAVSLDCSENLPDELLVDVAHLHVVDGFGVEVDLGEALQDSIEEVGVVEAVDLVEETRIVRRWPLRWVRSLRCRT